MKTYSFYKINIIHPSNPDSFFKINIIHPSKLNLFKKINITYLSNSEVNIFKKSKFWHDE